MIKVSAIPVFLAAAAVITVVTVLAERHGRSALAWALGLECIVLTVFMIAAIAGEPLADPNAVPVVIASLTGLFAMGAQSAMVRLTMKGVASTNVMTTNTTQIAIDATELVLAWRAQRRMPADDGVAGGLSRRARPHRNAGADHAVVPARHRRRHRGLCARRPARADRSARDHVRLARVGVRAAIYKLKVTAAPRRCCRRRRW